MSSIPSPGDSPETPPDSTYLSVNPSHNIQTDNDRLAVLVEVDETDKNLVKTAGKDLPRAIRDLHTKSNLEIDHSELFAWNFDSNLVYGVTAYSNKIQDDVQKTLTDNFGTTRQVRPPVKKAYEYVIGNLPDGLDVTIGTIPLGMFGRQPAVTSRLVMKEQNEKIVHADKLDDAGLAQLIKDYPDQLWLYYLHIRRNTGLAEGFEYQLVPRIALFDPCHRLAKPSDYPQTLKYGRSADPATSFDDVGTTSSLSLIDDEYSLYSTGKGLEVHPRSSSQMSLPVAEMDMLTGDAQFDEFRGGRYGASDKLESLCAYSSVMAREVDLETFAALVAPSPNQDPTPTIPGVEVFGTDVLSGDLSELSADPVLIPADPGVDPDGEITSQQPSTANDGTELHMQAIKDTALALISEGYEVRIVRQDSSTLPDLWARDSSGEIFGVEVECSTRSSPAAFLTNLARQALWGYKTITVMVPRENKQGQRESLDTICNWALDKAAKPVDSREPLDESKTPVHTHNRTITVDGKTMLLRKGMSEASWYGLPSGRYVLVDGHQIIAEGSATDPIEEFSFHVPRYYEDGDRFVVEDKDGEIIQICSDEADIENACLSPPYRPVDLSYIHYMEALYGYDPETRELVQHEMTAPWDTSQASKRHRKSIEDAFSSFFVETDGSRLKESECRPFVTEWVGALSAHGPTPINQYGTYRIPDRRGNTDSDSVKYFFYDDWAFRFERGAVAPDTNGLDSKPVFPADWDVDDEEVLKEPLIHGIDDIRDIDFG